MSATELQAIEAEVARHAHGRVPRELRRRQLLAVAEALFVERGYAATSMDDVAAEAGVTKLIVYRHFESKDDLYRAVLDRTTVRLAEELASGAGRPGVAVRTLLAVAREDPDGFELLWRHAAREAPFADYAAGVFASAVDLAAAVLPADLRSSPLGGWAAEAVVGHLVDAVLAWVAHGPDESDDETFVAAAGAGVPALVRAWTASIRD